MNTTSLALMNGRAATAPSTIALNKQQSDVYHKAKPLVSEANITNILNTSLSIF